MENNNQTNEDIKLAPYQRLTSILSEGDGLSERGSQNLDEILGINKEKRVTFVDKVLDFFKKIDSKIFKKKTKAELMWNNTPHKRMR